ncbi:MULTISPECIES: LysE family translocator [Ralstonia solanacearum species complex]|uniref:LysE family translocator n=2 Tax=Ralstonia solanacearum species complex TaxID=3116862 RepID=A0A0K1ZJ01_RALSL|nr:MULTISPECIES: LysE family translocator [Ralstonia]AKZ25999.1 LysE family protein [Ralstonia solanacearum]APF86544.1 lysine transporter LysE [Ralstonia solanacearum FJAT-1458]KAF3460280.1 LysE family translocator [Ralstonia solanacearum]MBX9428125.1 LysE family translocator [Ralstonia pseudosolanacearum]MCF1441634.1 LysE family translocator [Ralstonia solanacearum]
MPIQETLLKMSFYVSLVLIMPGPTNTLLLSSGLKVGVRRTRHLVMAEALGYVIAISLWGFFLCSLAASRPWLLDAIKLLSSVYILYLAVKMWTKSRALQHVEAGPVGFRDVFVTTLMNPKALLFASTLFPLEAFRSAAYFAWAMAVFLIVLAPIGIGWSYLGVLLTSRRAWAPHTPKLLRGAALVLLMFSGTLMFSILGR